MKPGNNSFNTLSTLDVNGEEYSYFSLDKLAAQGLSAIHRLPYSLKILLENILRFERGGDDAAGDIKAFAEWVEARSSEREIAFRPTRVLMQDLTGVPAVVDLAAMRDAAGDNPQGINPQIPVDLIRTLNANGTARLEKAYLSGMTFENMVLGVNSANGQLRMYPITAELFEGSYNGDIKINVAGDVPSISVNENVTGVQLAPLAKAMFDQENITGTIEGSFKLSGSGNNLSAIRRDLDGSMALRGLQRDVGQGSGVGQHST